MRLHVTRPKATGKPRFKRNEAAKDAAESPRPWIPWETRRRRVLLVGLILAVAAFLRLHQLSSVPYGMHADEAVNGNLAEQILETSQCRIYYPENMEPKDSTRT
jgi:hypothetical protein